ncbi:hypothetical protein [Rubinisphaera italica]|uniref:Caudovirus prohead protease n=1 Tax=Rubinisphaera italica TaxID=2527969 RepID=A0A5C5XKW8_9PLAN|nr:hypothetical protein [Rubinisphaera italica]TWT63189.1 hypothetical protein Pan54_39420 [Rubinisphaera italica]
MPTTMKNRSQQPPDEVLSVPATMLMSGDGEKNITPVRLQARSKEVLDHWWWGPMVHDFAGMSHKNKIAIDYCHDSEQIIGYCDQFEQTDYGLELVGELTSLHDQDRAAEIVGKFEAGVPYEASITFRYDNAEAEIEYVPYGAEVEINGVTLEGPLTVFRKWNLIGVAICPHGYDSNTNVELSRDQYFESLKGDHAMPGTKAKTTPEVKTKETELENNEPTPKVKTPETKTELEKPADKTSAVDQVKTELKKFTERFGGSGAEMYVEGLSYADALDKHARQLEAELSKKDETIAELQGKLKAIDTGEAEPVSSGKEELSGEKKKGRGVSDQLSAGIRIQGRKYDS